MDEIGIPKGPLFANALRCGREENVGRYYFIPDLIFIPIESWDLQKHKEG
jgi:hypothetical protein